MEEALRLASHANLDAAILDVNVGGAVVFPVADVLRGRGVPIIFATGYGSGLPSRFRKDPALSKPFSYEELAEASPRRSRQPALPYRSSLGGTS